MKVKKLLWWIDNISKDVELLKNSKQRFIGTSVLTASQLLSGQMSKKEWIPN